MQGPIALGDQGASPTASGLAAPGRLAALPMLSAEGAAALAEPHAGLGNASGSAYWPPAYDRLPPNDEDPVAVQTFWARNAAAGLEYVLEHRWVPGKVCSSTVRGLYPFWNRLHLFV